MNPVELKITYLITHVNVREMDGPRKDGTLPNLVGWAEATGLADELHVARFIKKTPNGCVDSACSQGG